MSVRAVFLDLNGTLVLPVQANTPVSYQQAAQNFGIDVSRSYVIGDTLSDVQAAQAIGARGCLVRTGWGEQAVEDARALNSYIAADLADAARWIADEMRILC